MSNPVTSLPKPRPVEVFFDGACPLCVREMRLLRRWDTHGAIRFTDIAEPSFEPQKIVDSQGRPLDYDRLMSRLHGRSADGELIEGVEVFRQLYAAVGFRRLVAISRLPLIRSLLDRAYSLFARNRLRLTGRCHSGACAVPARGH